MARTGWEGIDAQAIQLRINEGCKRSHLSFLEYDRAVVAKLDHLKHAGQFRAGEPPHAYWDVAADVLGVSRDWLVYGQGQMVVTKD